MEMKWRQKSASVTIAKQEVEEMASKMVKMTQKLRDPDWCF